MHQTQWSPERPLPPPVSLASQSHMRSPLRSPAQVEGTQGFLPQPGKDLERPSSTRLEARFPYHGSGLIFVNRYKEWICKYLGYYSSLKLVKLLSAASAIKTPLDFCLFVSQSCYSYQVVILLSDRFESLTDSIASFIGLLVSGWFFMMYAGDNYLPA